MKNIKLCGNDFLDEDEHFGEVKTEVEWLKEETSISEEDKEMLYNADISKDHYVCEGCWKVYMENLSIRTSI